MTDASSDSRAPRRAALALIRAVTADRVSLSDAAPAVLGALSPPDRARALRLATETLRFAAPCDLVLKPYLKSPPREAGHWMLRLGTWEIAADGAGSHGVVNDLVSLAGEHPSTARLKGLINAVLRRVAEAGAEWDTLPAPRLPQWLKRPLNAAYGKARVREMERAHGAGAPMDLTPKTGSGDLAEALGAEVLPGGSLRLPARAQVTQLAGFAEGLWWVQDAAAAVPARILEARPGERVLDLCAAPGGKTMQLAATGADVTALDVSEDRMVRVRENLARVGLEATMVLADALEWGDADGFDAILLDAPCSATGTLRRHPDLPYIRDLSALKTLLPLQSALIDRAVALLKPGGRLVYCTCSLLREEGEQQVSSALERHPGLAMEHPDPDWLPDGVKTPKGLRLTPEQMADIGGWDGFYIARLSKPVAWG